MVAEPSPAPVQRTRRRPCGRGGDVRRHVPVEEGADVVERPDPFGAECHDHAPMICSHTGSCSLPVGNRLPAHAHFSLDNALAGAIPCGLVWRARIKGLVPRPRARLHLPGRTAPEPFMNRIRGKTAIVTGATAGIGEATARSLADAGVRTVLIGRRNDRLESMAADIAGSSGTEVRTFVLDVRDRAGVVAFTGLAGTRGRDRRHPDQQRRPVPRPGHRAGGEGRRLGRHDRHQPQGPPQHDARAAAGG